MSLHRAAASVSFLLFGACAADTADHWGRHLDGAVWVDALAVQTQRPELLLPALGLLEASIGLAFADHHIQEQAVEDHPITNGDTKNGDAVAVGLGVLATGLGVGELVSGDGGHGLETLGESFLLVEGTTELLKRVVGRRRPGHGSPDSFPSGHASFAFTMATYVARRDADLGDEWYNSLGWFAYAPAAYVGINRVEGNRHWPSDVAFGAFLGVFMTNVVYDAHYGSPNHQSIFAPQHHSQLTIEPTVGTEHSELDFVLHF
jgi:membrane-associated phospholipid phosphatase